RGEVRRVPVDRVSSRVHLSFTDINVYLATQGTRARVGSQGSQLRISGPVTLAGVTYQLAGNANIGVSGDSVTLTPTGLAAGGGRLRPPGLRPPASRALPRRFPARGLPFNLHLQSAKVDGDGLTFTAGGTGVILTNPSPNPAG